ncbi:hypothetical protein HYZ76_00640 [Candidatus Falkowbacteria bacterium]|nr:hypothetical protein [Candidatus Falkowbacteria bacterium]
MAKASKAKIGGLLLLCFFVSGCKQAVEPVTDFVGTFSGKIQLEQKKQAEKTLATIKCQELCQTILTTDGQDFDIGPCLSDKIIPDWVCDIAHEPRQEVDDDPANQCGAFRTGEAHHFVEVDGNCSLIQVY